jgi:hypothetical protein
LARLRADLVGHRMIAQDVLLSETKSEAGERARLTFKGGTLCGSRFGLNSSRVAEEVGKAPCHLVDA